VLARGGGCPLAWRSPKELLGGKQGCL
jgi:hypothetical protein